MKVCSSLQVKIFKINTKCSSENIAKLACLAISHCSFSKLWLTGLAINHSRSQALFTGYCMHYEWRCPIQGPTEKPDDF
jgi:hypothetical protein